MDIKKDMEKKLFRMKDFNIKDTGNKDSVTVMESRRGMMAQCTMVNGLKTRLKVKVYINGLIKECIMVHLKIISCMALASILGQMVANT